MHQEQETATGTGYLSEDGKKTFTIVAGVLGAFFFVVQFAAPIVVMIVAMPVMFRSTMTTASAESSALYQGRVHLVETTRGLADESGAPSKSRIVRIESGGLEEVAPLGGWQPWLLADGDRLWLISSTRMGLLENGRVNPVEMPEPLGEIRRPFLLGGKPAVVESRPDGARVMVWQGDTWRETRPLPGVDCRCGVQALARGEGVLIFRQEEKTLYAIDPAEEKAKWNVVVTAPSSWYAFEMDGQPAVASIGSDSELGIVEYDGRRWRSVGISRRLKGYTSSLAGFQAQAGSSLIVLTQAYPNSLNLFSWEGTRFVGERRFGQSSPFPRGMFLLMMVPQASVMLLSLALAAILSALMRTHRVGSYAYQGREIEFASLTRRAISQLVDTGILALPMAAGFWWMFERFESDLSGPEIPWRLFTLVGALFAWMVAIFFGFSATEGFWGTSPGKWLTGIRVVGTDLRPCGFGRALLRNLLKLIDGFFNFLVGILMVAFTEKWQRLGDLAARTIVVRSTGRNSLSAPRLPGGN